jgi:hypothetical protein
MEIENISTEELQAELERRDLEGHNHRQSEIFRGEREDFTDGDQHIEDARQS